MVQSRKYDGFHNGKTFPNLKDEDIVDWHSVDYCVERLSKKRKKPYFHCLRALQTTPGICGATQILQGFSPR